MSGWLKSLTNYQENIIIISSIVFMFMIFSGIFYIIKKKGITIKHDNTEIDIPAEVEDKK